jgi:hypothetical protein
MMSLSDQSPSTPGSVKRASPTSASNASQFDRAVRMTSSTSVMVSDYPWLTSGDTVND